MILTSRPWNSEYTLENQTRRINSLQNALDERGIFYVKMYDALDSQPFNGRLDAYNDTYLLDGVHPDQNGHTKMAQYLWISLNKQPLNGR
jgi:lysophospholipase L1-like esterase